MLADKQVAITILRNEYSKARISIPDCRLSIKLSKTLRGRGTKRLFTCCAANHHNVNITIRSIERLITVFTYTASNLTFSITSPMILYRSDSKAFTSAE